MLIRTLVVGAIETNCYLVGCPDTKEGAVIDPGDDGPRILRAIAESGLSIKYIINTHGHVDHISANGAVKEATGALILIHERDAASLTDPRRSLAAFTGGGGGSPAADRQLREGEEIVLGRVRLTVLHTPGHTPGGISLAGEGVLFTGDTLFAGSVGRTDFPGGSFEQLLASIKEKLLVYPDETVVYPGHGPASTVGEERRGNPFLLGGW